MSGTIFFVCPTSWIDRCVLAQPVSLASRNLSAKQPSSLDSGLSYSLRKCRLGWHSEFTSAERSVRDRVQNPTVCSQEWQRDYILFSSAGRPVRKISQRSSAGRPVRGIQNQLARTKLAYHNLHICGNLYHEKVFTNVRQKLNRSEEDQSLDQKGNSTSRRTWSWTRNQGFWMFPRLNGNLFTPWMRSTSLRDKGIKWAKAKVHVHSDSVLCLGKMHEYSEANGNWKDQLQYFQQSNEYKELFGIDGEPIEL